jgi:hypothetical protein
MQLHDPRDHRRMVSLIKTCASQSPCGIEQIGCSGNAGELLLHAFKPADGNMELFAHARISAAGMGRESSARR